ncbi:MAG: 3-dehydroquinate dehydratase [Eubacteriales bacterium]|nr:3-dehydroquinate dehydratase [Eubacteriales bacterium]
MRFLVINGPNINLLGLRNPAVYGEQNYEQLLKLIRRVGREEKISLTIRQSNHEGDIVDMIQRAYGKYDGIVINAGGYTHTSVAIADALEAVAIPAAEVHVSDTENREDFRKTSFLRAYCAVVVIGKGLEGYREAIRRLKKAITEQKTIA